MLIFSALLMVFVVSCSKTDDFNSQGLGEEMLIGISTSGIEYEPLPNPTRSSDGENLLAVQVYEVENGNYTPYAKGLFNNWNTLNFKGYSGTIYKVEATMVVDATSKLQKVGEVYGKPFGLSAENSFVYDSEPITGIASSTATLADNTEYAIPTIDRYYGYSEKQVTQADATITTSMKRMAFGVKTSGLDKEVTINVAGAPSVALSAGAMAIYSLGDFNAAYTADETTESYGETLAVEIIKGGSSIYNEDVEFQRNKLAIITIDGSDVSIGFEFEDAFEDKDTPSNLRVLTFEDSDYVGAGNMLGNKDWSSLIDNPEYGEGGLLYGEQMFVTSIKLGKYEWYDEGNTELAHKFLGGSFGTLDYAGGGHAISNYVETDLSKGDYTRQLSVVVKDPNTGFGGYGGSENFAMHYGYIDNSGFGMTTNLPHIYFKDDTPRVIDHMYVAPNTYLANCVTNGNGLTDPLGNEGYVNIIAIGYNGDTKVGELKFELANENGFIDKWTKWDLSSLGKVTKVEFNMEGDSDNGYGFSQPAYFAYDNVAVRFE